MARRGEGGHNISPSFGGEQSTPSTPTTPTTPTTHVTGSHFSGRMSRRGGRNFSDVATGLENNRTVSRNLEMAYLGDDSLLLPIKTNSSRPQRPRTLAAGYDKENHVLFVRFRDGAGYEYHDVTQSQWRTFRDNASPGKYINSELNHHLYFPADW